MIRMALVSDVPEMLKIYAPYVENTTVSFEYTVPDTEEFERRFHTYTRQFPWLVYERDGRVLGYAYGSAPFERQAYGYCAEVSIYLAQEAMGRGVGAGLYAALERILCLQGYQVVYSLVTSENSRSLRFHEKQGYRLFAAFDRCGYKFGRWLGVNWLEKRLEIVDNPGEFPASWRTIVQNDEKLRDILASLSISNL